MRHGPGPVDFTLSEPDRLNIIKAALDAVDQSSSQSMSLMSMGTFKISGDVRAAMGIDAGGNAIFTRANADLNERNWRILSSSGLNNNINTYDPAIYSRLKVVMDASVASGVVSVHLNLTADPWSFTGKTKAQLVAGEGGDKAQCPIFDLGQFRIFGQQYR